jgi:hypothetical protein
LGIFPVDKSTNWGYNNHITIGNTPNQKRTCKKLEFLTSPSNNQISLDYYLSLILPSMVNLTSANPNNEGRTLT